MTAKATITQQLTRWLKSDQPKTIGSLIAVFEKQSFAVAFSLLPVLSAVPVPSLGVSNALVAICALFGLQLLLGQKTPWLPSWIAQRSVPQSITEHTIPYITKKFSQIEKKSKKYHSKLINHAISLRFIAGCVILFSLMAMIAPPFTNLDTPPALGVILCGLGMLFGDVRIVLTGLACGIVGLVLFGASISLVIVTLTEFFMF